MTNADNAKNIDFHVSVVKLTGRSFLQLVMVDKHQYDEYSTQIMLKLKDGKFEGILKGELFIKIVEGNLLQFFFLRQSKNISPIWITFETRSEWSCTCFYIWQLLSGISVDDCFICNLLRSK